MFRRLALLILFLLIANNFVQSQDSEGWIPVTREEYIDWDLENVPVEIKTNSTLGSYELVRLYLYNAQYDHAGGVDILFSSTPRYDLFYCSRSWTDFPTTLPSATEKIWRITLDRSAGIRVMIHCNGVEVVNFLLSDETCTSYRFRSSWSSNWSRNVAKLYFSYSDRASDYYRPYTGTEYTSDDLETDTAYWSSCVFEGVDFHGANIGNLVVSSGLAGCHTECKGNRYCKSAMYRSSDQRCFLKYRRGGDLGPSLVTGVTSFNMFCDLKSDQTCAKQNVDYPGADLGARPVNSMDQCEQFCRATNRCKSITYQASTQTCWLKSRASGAAGPARKIGFTSLNMECPSSYQYLSTECLYYDRDFPGADQIYLITNKNDVEICEEFCREEPLCVSFTYWPQYGDCWLKNREYGESGPTTKAGLVSKNMNCS